MEEHCQDAHLYVVFPKKSTRSGRLAQADAITALGRVSTAYFEGVADIEANTSKELTKLGAVIQVPFRHGNQFLGEGGVQVSL